MTDPEPTHLPRPLRLPRLTPGVWVVLSIVAGAAPWVAAAVQSYHPYQ
jgi:hypothetical protein